MVRATQHQGAQTLSLCLQVCNVYVVCNNAGSPMVPWRYCARPHAVGAWVTHPLEAGTPSPPPSHQLVEEQPPSDESVATLDPLVGLIAMQVSLLSVVARIVS